VHTQGIRTPTLRSTTSVPPAAAAELDGVDGYVAREPAAAASEAVARVTDAGIDDARIWGDYPLSALP
jgi:hypothetical protein